MLSQIIATCVSFARRTIWMVFWKCAEQSMAELKMWRQTMHYLSLSNTSLMPTRNHTSKRRYKRDGISSHPQPENHPFGTHSHFTKKLLRDYVLMNIYSKLQDFFTWHYVCECLYLYGICSPANLVKEKCMISFTWVECIHYPLVWEKCMIFFIWGEGIHL